MRIKLQYIGLSFFVFFLIILYFFFDFDAHILKSICSMVVLAESIYITYTIRNNKCGFLMMLVITYEVYSIIVSRYLGYKTSDSIVARYDANISEQIYGLAICILLVWMTIFLYEMCSNKRNVESVVKPREQGNTNSFIGAVCILATLMILILKFDFSVLGSGQRGGVSAVFEYAIIFFVLGYYYAANKKWIRYSLNFILLVYCTVAFLAGERIGVVQMIFVPFLLYYGTRISSKLMLVIITIGIVAMTIVANYRTSFYGNVFSVSKAIDSLWDGKMAFDGADHGFYTSLTMLLMAEIDSWSFRLQHGIEYIGCIVLGDKSWLQHYTYNYFPHTYGGFVPYITYYYFGWIGVILSPIFVGRVLKKSQFIINSKKNKKKSDYCGMLIILLVSTTFRWFAYSYMLLFRMLFFYTLVFIAFEFIDSFKRKV